MPEAQSVLRALMNRTSHNENKALESEVDRRYPRTQHNRSRIGLPRNVLGRELRLLICAATATN